MADFDLAQDQTHWDENCLTTHGYIEHVDLQELKTGRIFMVPTSIPTIFTMEYIANEGWTFFTLEQDLSSVGEGLRVKVVGTTDSCGA